MTDEVEGAKEKSAGDSSEDAGPEKKKKATGPSEETANQRLTDLLEKTLTVLDKAVDMRVQESKANTAAATQQNGLQSDTFKSVFAPRTNGSAPKTTTPPAGTFKAIFTQENHKKEAAEPKKEAEPKIEQRPLETPKVPEAPKQTAGKTVADIFKKAFDSDAGPAEEPEGAPGAGLFKDPFEKTLIVSEIEKRLEKKGTDEKKDADEKKEEPQKPADMFKNIFAQGNTAAVSKETKPPDASSATQPEEGKPPKPADMFKNIFSAGKADATQQAKLKEVVAAEAAEKKPNPAAELFRNVFSQNDALTNAPDKKPDAAAQAAAEDKTKVQIADVMKDAHEKGRIDKATYDQAIEKIVKNNIEGGSLVGGFKVVQRSGRSEILLDEGAIEIPSGSKVEVIKKGGEISIIVRKSDSAGVEGDVDMLQGLSDDGKEEKKDGDKKAAGKGIRHDWLEGHEDDEVGASTELKDEFDLTDLRKEYRQKKKKEAEAEEENKEEVEEEAEPSIFDRLFKRIKKTTEESPQDKLRRLSLENLSRMRGAEDERRTIVGIAYVLKQFLELKYEIPHELTYTELIREIRNRPMNNDLRTRLITFFKNTSLMVYASGPKTDNAQKAYSLAERAIKELS